MRNEKLDIFRGLAMIWVILAHCLYWLEFFASVRPFLLIGTTMFFFISGASNGMSSKKSLKGFYTNRFERILIPYWIYSAICIVLIVIVSQPETIKSFFQLALGWINPFGFHSSSILYLTWALWFVPVYLLVMLMFPLLKKVYTIYYNTNKYYIPLVVMIILICVLNFFENSDKILYYAKMLVFYGFFTYLGMFFTDIFKKIRILTASLIVVVCVAVMCVLVVYCGQSLDMQVNKFPPNFMFFVFSLAACSVLYIFSDVIVNVIKFMRKSTVLDWIFQQYVKNGLIIFLFHPFVFLLLSWLKNEVFIGINSKISFVIILFLAIPLISITAKCFSWVGKIRIAKKPQ